MKYQISKAKLAELNRLRDQALQMERDGIELPEWKPAEAQDNDTDEMKMHCFHRDLVIDAIRRRRELGLSQEDLAKKMGTTQSVISRFEHFGRKPSTEFLVKISWALDISFKMLDKEDIVLKLHPAKRKQLDDHIQKNHQTYDQAITYALDTFWGHQAYATVDYPAVLKKDSVYDELLITAEHFVQNAPMKEKYQVNCIQEPRSKYEKRK